VYIPQADTFALNSAGMIAKETYKKDTKKINRLGKEGDLYSTGYPQKQGYLRYKGDEYSEEQVFVTNIARNQHLPGKKESYYHPRGNVEIFAQNIWRKYFKKDPNNTEIVDYNEGIAFQEGHDNPIEGLMVQIDSFNNDLYPLLDILKRNKSLKLYLYHPQSKEHIVRYLDNSDAIEFISSSRKPMSVFATAKPFQGFDSLLASQKVQPVKYSSQSLLEDIQKLVSKAYDDYKKYHESRDSEFNKKVKKLTAWVNTDANIEQNHLFALKNAVYKTQSPTDALNLLTQFCNRSTTSYQPYSFATYLLDEASSMLLKEDLLPINTGCIRYSKEAWEDVNQRFMKWNASLSDDNGLKLT
jgi:hypothetical protein